MAGLGLPVAVGDLEPGRLAPGRDHLGVERLAGGDHPPQRRRSAAARARFASTRYSVGAWQRTLTPSRSISSSRSSGVEAAVDDHRRGAAEPRGEEDVARRLRPAGRGRAPDEVAVAGAEPVLGLGALPGQVALRVQRRARLAGGSRGEHDQRRVLGVEIDDLDRRFLGAVLVERLRRPRPSSCTGSRPAARRAARSSPTQSAGFAAAARSSRSWRRSWVLQGRATAPIRQQASIASTHSSAVADQGHDDVAAADPARGERAREARRHRDQLAEVPDAAPAVGVDREQGRLRGRKALEHVLDQVHGGESAESGARLRCGSSGSATPEGISCSRHPNEED